jgi:hypothetical protein
MSKKIILEFIVGCVLSLVSAICFGMLYFLPSEVVGIEIFFGGDKAGPFFVLFLGVPIGAFVGISLVDKLMFKSRGYNILGLTLGFILCQLGILFGVFLMDLIGGTAVVFIPFIAVFLSLVGYNIKFLFR